MNFAVYTLFSDTAKIMTFIATGGTSGVLYAIFNGGLGIYNLYKSIEALKGDDVKEMMVCLGKAAGYAVRAVTAFFTGMRRRKFKK